MLIYLLMNMCELVSISTVCVTSSGTSLQPLQRRHFSPQVPQSESYLGLGTISLDYTEAA